MLNAAVGCFLVLLLSEGCGRWLFRFVKYEPDYAMYCAPYGIAFIFAVLEILYLPAMMFHLPFGYIKFVSVVLLAALVIPFLYTWKDIYHMHFRGRTLYIISALLTSAAIFQKLGINAFINDAQLLTMASQIGKNVALESPLQGYYLFGSVGVWACNMDLKEAALLLGLVTAAIGMMMALNFVDSFDLPNPWFRFTLIFFELFYCCFYSWKITGAFHAANWRLLFVGLVMYTLYRWLKRDDEKIKMMIPILFVAGLFVTNGFAMIGIEITYCLCVFLLKEKKIRALYDTLSFLAPAVYYGSALLMLNSVLLGLIPAVLYTTLLMIRKKSDMYRKLIKIEDFLIAYNRRIFYMIIPAIFLVGTFLMRFAIKGYGIEYTHYISYFSSNTIAGFLFPRGNVIDIVMDIWRWAGLFVLFKSAFLKEDRMVRDILLCMVIFFINPLCMGMLTEMTGVEVYSYAFEIIFNPFTDILIFIAIYRVFEWTIIGQWILELCLVFAVVLGHAGSYTNLPMGLYRDLISPAEIEEVRLP